MLTVAERAEFDKVASVDELNELARRLLYSEDRLVGLMTEAEVWTLYYDTGACLTESEKLRRAVKGE